MSERQKLIAIGILLSILVILAVHHLGAIPEKQQVTLDLREWECTEYQTYFVGMAVGKRCSKWERRP